jgi:hypothetical protein
MRPETPDISLESEPFPLLRVAGFPPHVDAAFTTRLGGASTGPHASLNLGLDTGDDPSVVEENYRRIAAALEYPCDHLAFAFQVHGRRVLVARSPEDARGARAEEADGIVLAPPADSSTSLAALVRVADCCPVLIASTRIRAAAVLHCGWRSTVADLPAAGVAALLAAANHGPDDLCAAVGPCIGPEAFEVSGEVASRFEAVHPDIVVRRASWPRPHVDLPGAVALLLERAGIHRRRIARSSLCTVERPDLLFSYRRDGERSGRQAGIVVLHGRTGSGRGAPKRRPG